MSELKEHLDKVMEEPDSSSSPAPERPQTAAPRPRPSSAERREHAKLYQREYRRKQKELTVTLQRTQVKGANIWVVFSDGTILAKDLNSETDYVEVLEGLLESIKNRGHILSFKIDTHTSR